MQRFDRLATIERDGTMLLRTADGRWHRGSEAVRRATKTEKAEAERQRQQQRAELPFYDQTTDTYYYPWAREYGLLECDVLLDLQYILGFTEAEAAMILETSKSMARLKAFIDQD